MAETNTQFFNGRLPSCSYSDEDFTDEKNTKLLFARGYLICKDPNVDINPHFFQRYLGGGFYLYTHSLCRVESGSCNGTNVTILGLAVFATRSSKNENIARTLAEIFAKDGRDAFLDTLDCLGGSYVVILDSNDKIELFPDAVTLRGVFYAPEEKVVSSNPNLAHRVVKRGDSALQKYVRDKKYFMRRAYVDDSTNNEGIFRLIPNFSLRFDDFSTQRFYPRKQRKILDFESKLGGGGATFSSQKGALQRISYSIRKFKIDRRQ